ncbi:MAG: DNA primase [bacterium]
MNSPVDDIKNKLDLIDVIQGYIKLQKAGRNYRAPCPFHSEKTPSFMVSPERQLWRCFGCGKGGSMFDFVMEMEGLEFGDALRILAQRAGVELKRIDPELKTERTRIYEICDLANRFFIKQLQASKAGEGIKKYLVDRGLKLQTIKDWQIGYAPKQWQSLLSFLNSNGYSDVEISKSGLSIKKEERNEYYDRFRDRIIFPINDINGIVVGFTGRENPNNPDDRMGKYINIPNTLIYDKSRILYGLDKAKMDIRKNDFCILAEGQTDVIMSHQSGFNNVVASSGTALTEEQLKIIKRYTDNLTTAFDMDIAGETATKRGADLAIEFGFNTKVISLPDNQDPASCLQKDSSVWKKAIEQAQDLIEFYLSSVSSKNDIETVQGKKEISRVILPIIKRIPNKVEQAHWLQKIAQRLRVQENVLLEEMSKVKDFATNSKESNTGNSSEKSNFKDKKHDLEEHTLGLILSSPKLIKYCNGKPEYLFGNSDLVEIFKIIKQSKINKNKPIDFKKIFPSNLVDKVDKLVFMTEAKNNINDDFNSEKEIEFCFNQLKSRYFKHELSQLNLSIQEAESNKDEPSIKKLTEKFNKLSKQII